MYEQRLYLQGPSGAEMGQMVQGICDSLVAPMNEYYAAVAYATLSGCRIICEQLRNASEWLGCGKKWLISIDFGRTEPDALEYLAELPQAEVRIPNGKTVLQTAGFIPPVVFHSKAHLSRGGSSRKALAPLGVFIGSANLTGSGLTNGYECGVMERWTAPLTRSDRRAMHDVLRNLTLLEGLWHAADPLDEILPTYRRIWSQSPPPAKIVDEEPIPDTGSDGDILRPDLLARAQGLWAEVEELYKNRGRYEAGNQLDLPRGARVFFGFPPDAVPRNTIFGNVVITCEGYDPVVRSMRFGNNMMDKINLPVPGKAGPKTYDHSFLLFERNGIDALGRPVFGLRLGKASDVKKWKKAAKGHADAKMAGGRPFGLLF